MNKDLLGYLVDVVGIISLTILGALKVLPESMIMSGLTMILVGRIRPSPPSGPSGVVGTSGLMTTMVIFGVLASNAARMVLVRRFA